MLLRLSASDKSSVSESVFGGCARLSRYDKYEIENESSGELSAASISCFGESDDKQVQNHSQTKWESCCFQVVGRKSRNMKDMRWTSDMKTKHDPADNSHRICTYSRKITFLTITNVYETTRRQNVDQGLRVVNLAWIRRGKIPTFSKTTNTSVEILGSNMKRWTWLWNRICVLTAENIHFVSSSHMLPMTRQWTAKVTNKVALILAVCL